MPRDFVQHGCILTTSVVVGTNSSRVHCSKTLSHPLPESIVATVPFTFRSYRTHKPLSYRTFRSSALQPEPEAGAAAAAAAAESWLAVLPCELPRPENLRRIESGMRALQEEMIEVLKNEQL